jgi:hypothetical protein
VRFVVRRRGLYHAGRAALSPQPPACTCNRSSSWCPRPPCCPR